MATKIMQGKTLDLKIYLELWLFKIVQKFKEPNYKRELLTKIVCKL